MYGRGPLTDAAVTRVLVVEDDRDIADLVAHYLRRTGYVVDVLYTGTEVLPHVQQQAPDLVLLDLLLPGLNGLEICRAMRADPGLAAIPIIMLTAKSEEADRIVGLELGGDDYVTKPFSPKELVARVGAVLRRAGRSRAGQRLLRFGPVLVDTEQHLVTDDGQEVRLTAKEFLLLKYL
ncbi:MAG: response regulator transcription factor, partial [Acidobacteria bacterium]|nr:response regulator transcription factor [Acidobacteriota bacterium]